MSISFDFSGKTVLVTGGTRGIGLGIARAFQDAGAQVTVTGTAAEVSSYDEDLSAFGYLQCRLDNKDDRAAVSEAFESLDILVNNAGAPGKNEFEAETVSNVMEVNLTAMADLCYQFKDRLAQTKGAIVNLSSVGGFVGMSGFPAYCSSKHAIIGLTRSLADRWAKTGIRINAIAPGFIETRGIDWARGDANMEKGVLAGIPARRWGQPEEIALGAMFLATEEADYIRGHCLVIDGGFLLR